MPASNKTAVLTELFEICQQKQNFIFDNDLVKEIAKKHNFKNPFDVTKIDNSSKLPLTLQFHDYFILHLGNGKHQFVENISIGYHQFEAIEASEIVETDYKRSLLNDLDSSESNILSVIRNQGLFHDFLGYGQDTKFYNSRRTNLSLNYWAGKTEIKLDNVQIEMDLVAEENGIVTVFEAKNGFADDFAVYQLYLPFLYYNKHVKATLGIPIEATRACYVLRKREVEQSIARLYHYTFDDSEHMASIRLIKKAEYRLKRK